MERTTQKHFTPSTLHRQAYLVPKKPGRKSHIWEPARNDTACLLGRACYNPALYHLAEAPATDLCWNCKSIARRSV